MQQKRKHERVNADREIDAEVILESDMEIIDISRSGVLFLCSKHVLINSTYRIQLTFQDNVTPLVIQGTVVRSTFKGINKASRERSPMYEVAMEFVDLTDDQNEILNKIKSFLP